MGTWTGTAAEIHFHPRYATICVGLWATKSVTFLQTLSATNRIGNPAGKDFRRNFFALQRACGISVSSHYGTCQ